MRGAQKLGARGNEARAGVRWRAEMRSRAEQKCWTSPGRTQRCGETIAPESRSGSRYGVDVRPCLWIRENALIP